MHTHTHIYVHICVSICSMCTSLACKICSTNEFKRINYYAYATLCEGRSRAESANVPTYQQFSLLFSFICKPEASLSLSHSLTHSLTHTQPPPQRRKLCQAFVFRSSSSLSSFLLVTLPVLPFRGCQKTFIQFCTEIHTHTYTLSLTHTHTTIHTQRIKV